MIRFALIALSAVVAALPVHAQTFPAKPIRLIVPFPPGGGTDFVSRTVATELGKSTGWTIVVDNKAGASGMLGLAEAAKAVNDGHDLVMGQADNLVIAPAMQKAPLNPLTDLTPVSLVATSAFLFMTNSGSKYKTLNEVISAAKATPNTITYGTAGTGTFAGLAMVLLERDGGFKLKEVPYKGATPAITDMLGGHIDLAALSIASGMAHIPSGKVRGLAVTSAQRSPALPEVPTVQELGFKGFEVNHFLGILVPNGVPPAIIARLNAEIGKALQSPELRKAMLGQGVEARHSTPEAFGAMLKDETTRWHGLIKAAGIKAE
ncbi:MAG TPA: tripartite tricarboxylate transporter substrate binding protein [Casimicrobiaceae bacterium]|nr:tripartite tricarboxylate transporter substrate binding protein [Casimicrobiaceae bacterium]